MNCPHCHTAHCVKNGTSRHGHQRWRCPVCHKTFGDKDRRLVAPETKAAALAQYLEGVGQRATERLLGVSHNSITNWVKQAVFGQALKPTPAEKVEWVEADELWTYIAKKKMIARHLERARLAARLTVVGSVTDVPEVVTALARTMEKIHREKNVAIEVHADEQARFRGEQPDLEEMIGNLVDNACKWASSRGAIEVVCERSDPASAGQVVRI